MSGRVSVVIASLAVVWLTGCGPGNTFAPPPAPPVTVVEVAPENVELFDEYSGRIEATQSVEVRARVRGFLERVHFEPGQLVAKGDTLFTIEQDGYRAAVDNAAAALERAKAAEQLAQTKFQMQRQLFDKEAISELEFRQAEAVLAESSAATRQAESALQTARLDLEYTTISAPIAGRVGRELVTIGNLVGASENTLLTTIVAENPVHAYFTASERAMLAFLRRQGGRTGEGRDIEVRLQLADGAQYQQPGRIDFADNQVAAETGTIELRAVFPNPDGLLVPGVFARVLVANPLADAILLPTRALQRDLSGAYVMLATPDNVAEQRYVTEGPASGARTVISEGLKPGDRVIVDGLQRVRPGLPVAVEASPQTPQAADAQNAGADASQTPRPAGDQPSA